MVPEEQDIEAYVNSFADTTIPNIAIVDVTTDKTEALFALQNRRVDMVMVVPANMPQNMEENKQSVFTFYHQEIDPFDISYVEIIVNRLTEQTNRDVLTTSVDQSKELAKTYQPKIHAMAEAEAQIINGDDPNAALNANNPNKASSSAILWLLLRSLSGAEKNPSTTAAEASLTDEEAQLAAIDEQLSKFVSMDSQIVVTPFRNEMRSLSEVEIKPVHFYVPSVLALLLQHIAISLAALSIVSERFSGTMEVMRASPANAFEILIGKYLSLFLFLGVLVALLTGLLHYGLGVPMLGNWSYFALATGLVVLVSLGFGFLISNFVRSDSQAVQFSMVFLLASIFFSGFFLQLYQLRWPAQIVSWILPTTYGIKTLQDIMLRGIQPQMNLLWILAGIAGGLFLINWARLRSLLVQK